MNIKFLREDAILPKYGTESAITLYNIISKIKRGHHEYQSN